MRTLIPFLWALLLFPALAAALSIQMPLLYTLHAANVNMLVSWSDVGTVKTVNILLANNDGKTVVATLASNVDAASGSTWVKIPGETAGGTDYYVVLQGNDNTSVSRGPFTVIFGGDGLPSSAAPQPSSSASASASSSASIPSSAAPSSSSSPSTPSSSSNRPSSSASSSGTATDPSDNSNGSEDHVDTGKMTSGQVAGIVVGVVGALAVAGTAALFVMMTRRRRQKQQQQQQQQDGSDYYSNQGDGGYVIDQQPMVGAVPRFAPPTPSNFVQSDQHNYMMPPPPASQYSAAQDKPHTPGAELHSPHQY